MKRLPERIAAQRVVLIRNSAEFAIQAAEAILESEAEFRAWQSWISKYQGVESCRAYSDWAARHWGSRFDFQIFRASDNLFLGQIALENFDSELASAEVGFWLRTSETGNGYTTEACGALLGQSFADLNLSGVILKCDERNVKSAGVARRVGMQLERVDPSERLDSSGELQNTMVWSLALKDMAQISRLFIQ